MTLPLSLEPVIGPMLEVAMNAPKKVKLSKRCEAGDHDFDHVTAACRRKHCTATLTAPLFPMTQAEEEATYGFSAARAALGLKPGDQQTTLFNPLGATQIGVLESLRRRGKWFEGCGWKWNTTRETVRALDSLAEKGLVTKSDDGKRVVYMPSAQQNPSLLGTLASWTAAGALADTVLTPVRNAVESMVGSALNPPGNPIEYLLRALEHAPPASKIPPPASDLRGWLTVGIFVCATCAGRIMARGAHLPPPAEPVWTDQPSPGSCVTCGRAGNPPAYGEREFRGAVAAAKRLLAAGPDSRVARRMFEKAVERCAGKSGVDPSDIAMGAMEVAQQETSSSNPPAPGEGLYTCCMFTSGGYAVDCEQQARGEGDQPPRGWTQPGVRVRTLAGNRRFHAYQCPACERYGREVRGRYERRNPLSVEDVLADYARSDTSDLVLRGLRGWLNAESVAKAMGVSERQASALLGAAVRRGTAHVLTRKTCGSIHRTLWRIVDAATNPPATALPEDPWRYFTAPPGTQLVPLSMISPIRARPGGIQRAGEFMLAAYEGREAPRKPITLAPAPDGTYVVCDGNSTFANAVASGWNAIPATFVQACEADPHQAAANPPRSTRVTFGRMSRGSGTEAGQADQDVLLDGQRAGVIEAEIVDANERSSSRSARYVVVGYRVTFWAVEAPDTTFAVQPGESPRAALARAQAHAIQVLEQLPPAQAQTNPWEPYHEPRQIPAWWLPGGHEDPAPVGGVSTEEIRQIARYEYEHELTPEQQDSAAINALGRAVFPWSSLTRGQLVKFRGEIQRQQTEARRAQDSPECRAKRHARCQGACRCWCHTQETQANPSDELDVQGDYASEATPLTVSVLTGMESPGGRMTVAEIAREAEVSESAVRKLLPSFKASGYVRRYETRRGRDVKRGYVWELSEKGMELLAWARRHAEEAPGATDFDPYEFEPKLPITGETVIDYEVDRGDPQDGPVTIHAYDKRAAREAGVLVMQLDPGYAEESRRFSGLSGPYALVVYVRVHPDYRRIGVGTRLHERAAREAAIRDLPLVSPDDRTRAEGAFWAKQLHKHRARLARYHDAKRPGASRYVLAYPPPDSLNPR